MPDEKINVHFRPQHTFIADDKGRLLVDHVGRFERINEDFNYIAGKAGFPEDIELPHRTSSNHSIYQNYFTEETKNIVKERFEKDLILFDYTF